LKVKTEAEQYIKVDATSYVLHTRSHWRTWCFHVSSK